MQEAQENISDETYIIDLDNNKITSKQKTSVTLTSNGRFKSSQKEDLPELPEHQTKKLRTALKNIIKPKQKKQQRLAQEDVDSIREAFFQFMVSVFQHYERYLQVNPQKNLEQQFSYSKYIEEAGNDQRPFFQAFLKLQMFTQFLERKIWAKKGQDVIDTIFFDESIRARCSGKKGSKNNVIPRTF